jgi:CheY-like chemotaxis protein
MNTVDMLEDLGHVVVSASSGEKALAQLRNRKFDLLVTDHAMPRMTGAQLLKETKVLFPEMAVILATGYAELPSGESSEAVRLPKPFSQGDLADALAKARQVTQPR